MYTVASSSHQQLPTPTQLQLPSYTPSQPCRRLPPPSPATTTPMRANGNHPDHRTVSKWPGSFSINQEWSLTGADSDCCETTATATSTSTTDYDGKDEEITKRMVALLFIRMVALVICNFIQQHQQWKFQ